MNARHALITGGAKRIGAALATYLHGKGMAVSIQYCHSKQEAHTLSDALNARRPGSAAAHYADFCTYNSKKLLMAAAKNTNGKVRAPDILLCCASSFASDHARDYVQRRAEEIFRVNLHAQIELATQFISENNGEHRADIIFLSDYIADITPESFLSYGASRAALHHAAQSLARQAADSNIRVNVIALGHVLPAPSQRQEHFNALCAQTPLKIATPLADITAALDFFLRAESVTGQLLYLDSGARLGYLPYADVSIL